MESYGQWLRYGYQALRTFDVDASVFMQYAQHDAVHAELLGGEDIVAHDFELVIGITEIARPRANQDVDGKAHLAANRLHESSAGSDSSRGQVTAELNPLRAAELRRDRVVYRFDADFQDITIHHELRAYGASTGNEVRWLAHADAGPQEVKLRAGRPELYTRQPARFVRRNTPRSAEFCDPARDCRWPTVKESLYLPTLEAARATQSCSRQYCFEGLRLPSARLSQH